MKCTLALVLILTGLNDFALKAQQVKASITPIRMSSEYQRIEFREGELRRTFDRVVVIRSTENPYRILDEGELFEGPIEIQYGNLKLTGYCLSLFSSQGARFERTVLPLSFRPTNSWKMGPLLFQGPVVVLNENGDTVANYVYENGLRNGLCQDFSTNISLEMVPLNQTEQYVTGQLHGTCAYAYKNQSKTVDSYDKGQLITRRYFDHSGVLRQSRNTDLSLLYYDKRGRLSQSLTKPRTHPNYDEPYHFSEFDTLGNLKVVGYFDDSTKKDSVKQWIWLNAKGKVLKSEHFKKQTVLASFEEEEEEIPFGWIYSAFPNFKYQEDRIRNYILRGIDWKVRKRESYLFVVETDQKGHIKSISVEDYEVPKKPNQKIAKIQSRLKALYGDEFDSEYHAVFKLDLRIEPN